MATPIVSWYTADNLSQVMSYDIGIIDAGSVSPDTTFLVWNNRDGDSDVSDMTSCTITTKDTTGGNTGEIVTNTWIQVKVDSNSELSFTPIGGSTTKAIQAEGAPTDTIKGTLNDGETTDLLNFAKITLNANVPANATAGNFDFVTRVSYQYV